MVMAIFISLSFTQHSLKHCITEVAFKNGQPLLNWQSIAFHIDKILVQNQSWRAADSIRPFIFNTVFALFSYSSSLGLWDWNFTAVLVEGNRIVDLVPRLRYSMRKLCVSYMTTALIYTLLDGHQANLCPFIRTCQQIIPTSPQSR